MNLWRQLVGKDDILALDTDFLAETIVADDFNHDGEYRDVLG